MYGNSGMRGIRRIQTYEEAKLRYEQIKPIRGRAGDVRPLGVRSNDDYRIAKLINPLNNTTSYQCILYQTPVVEFKSDGDVEINMGGYNSTATRTFIEKVLCLSCYSKNGSSVLCLGNKAEVVLHTTKTTVIRKLEAYPYTWELALGEPVHETQMNKKKATTVRQRYSEFEKYLKAMINLREETQMEGVMGNKYAYKRITFTTSEFAEAGVTEWGLQRPVGKAEMELMASDQPEESKHSNFYKAALGIVLAIRGGAAVRFFKGSELYLAAGSIMPKFREIVYRHHSDEVFEKVLLPVGKAPSKKYDSWVK
jgi:hypothetical protein